MYDLPPDYLNADEQLLTNNAEVADYQPDAVFCPGNWVPYFWPGTKVQLFHGFGIEKKGHFNIRGFFDLYCTHGPLTTQRFQAASKKHGYFRVVETGWPKMDPYASAVDLRNHIEIPPKVLYAPTFSPSLTSVYDLLQPLSELTATGQAEVTVKFHPLMAANALESYQAAENGHLKVVTDTDLLPALRQADILLSDTSSVVAESLCIGKPVVTYRTRQPGPHVLDFQQADELAQVLTNCVTHYVQRKAAGQHYANQMHPYRDGQSAERVLDAVAQHQSAGHHGLKALPHNWLRKYKVRKKMRRYD